MFAINTFTMINPRANTDFNTFYICIDCASYNNLFYDSFIKNTLFMCMQDATATDQASYIAKIL